MARRYRTKKEFLEALKGTGGIKQAIAKRLGITRRGVYKMITRFPDLKEHIKQEEGSIIDMAEGNLFKSVKDGDKWSVKFLLATKGKDRGYYEKREVDNKNSQENELQLIHKIVDEEENKQKTNK